MFNTAPPESTMTGTSMYSPGPELTGLLRLTVMSGAVGGVRESGLATIGSLEIGGFEVSDIPTVFPPAGPSAVDADRTAGNIGMGVLGRFRLVTDFANNRLWLSATPAALAAPLDELLLGRLGQVVKAEDVLFDEKIDEVLHHPRQAKVRYDPGALGRVFKQALLQELAEFRVVEGQFLAGLLGRLKGRGGYFPIGGALDKSHVPNTSPT